MSDAIAPIASLFGWKKEEIQTETSINEIYTGHEEKDGCTAEWHGFTSDEKRVVPSVSTTIVFNAPTSEKTATVENTDISEEEKPVDEVEVEAATETTTEDVIESSDKKSHSISGALRRLVGLKVTAETHEPQETHEAPSGENAEEDATEVAEGTEKKSHSITGTLRRLVGIKKAGEATEIPEVFPDDDEVEIAEKPKGSFRSNSNVQL